MDLALQKNLTISAPFYSTYRQARKAEMHVADVVSGDENPIRKNDRYLGKRLI